MRRGRRDVGHEAAEAMAGVLVVNRQVDPILMAWRTVRNGNGIRNGFVRKWISILVYNLICKKNPLTHDI